MRRLLSFGGELRAGAISQSDLVHRHVVHERLQAPAEELLLVRVDLEDEEPAEEDVLEAPGRTSRGSLCRPGQRYKKSATEKFVLAT